MAETLTAKEAASILGVAISTVQQWAKEGALPVACKDPLRLPSFAINHKAKYGVLPAATSGGLEERMLKESLLSQRAACAAQLNYIDTRLAEMDGSASVLHVRTRSKR